MNFIDAVLKYTEDAETPKIYSYWAALVSMAAVMKSHAYLDRFHYTAYPNIYVLLVGRSGLRKGPAISLAHTLVAQVNNTKIYSGRVSIQGVISDLARATTEENGGPPKTEAAGALFASEFASFIIQDPSALTILTDLYDGNYYDKIAWSYMLRNSPKETLRKPCITLFGATNEVHLKDAIPPNAVGGGFIARTFIIYSNKKNAINSLTQRPKANITREKLASILLEISKCKGEFKYSDKGRKLYDEWYDKFQEAGNQGDDTTGTMERLHEHILKTSMLISISRKRDMVLEYEDIEEAILACQDFVPGAKRVSMGQGTSISSGGTAVLLRELITNPEHEISKSKALQKHWANFDTFELDRIAESLFAQNAISIKIKSVGGGAKEAFYVLNPEVLKRYAEKKEK